MNDLQQLRAAVQRNCDISDAMFARNYSLCIYLLKMREYYRWEKGYALTAPLPRAEVGGWVDEREQLWEELESAEFDCLPVSRECYDPFDHAGVNQSLVSDGLVYSSGYGRFGKPHFFLGRLEDTQHHGDLTVYVSRDEFARDLSAPPAMLRGGTVFVRRESLRRMLWEMVDEWQWKKRPGPMARAVGHYDFERDPEAALDAMTDNEIAAVVLHEQGEAMVHRVVGNDWHAMLVAVEGTQAEIVLRAVRDHLADSLVTLPGLLERDNPASLDFYFANLRGMRKELFPRAASAYQRWVEGDAQQALRALIPAAQEHWRSLATAMVGRYRERRDDLEIAIEELRASRCPL